MSEIKLAEQIVALVLLQKLFTLGVYYNGSDAFSKTVVYLLETPLVGLLGLTCFSFTIFFFYIAFQYQGNPKP